MTGQPLDGKGRYSQTVVLDGKLYEPKYLPCATTDCLRMGVNLDMSDPATYAYVKALDRQVFKDIGTGATIGSLVTPVGVGGAVLTGVGLGATAGEVAISEAPVETARDEAIKAGLEKGGESTMRNLLGHTPAISARTSALIDLGGGWDAFTERVKQDLFGIKANDQKK
ncbi:MAG: hypothetical protein DCF26_20525 [Burkholderiales bacterium]|nr:MAG: hypothetical protein DCF26_20525 [Burkholderiales bacterium]